MTPEKPVWVGLMPDGIIARTMNDELPRVSGRSAPAAVVKTSTHQTLYLVQSDGMAAAVAVESIPEAETFSAGVPVGKVAPLQDPEQVVAMFSIPPAARKNDQMFLVSVTRSGMVKKSALSELPGPAAHTFAITRVNDGDELAFVAFSNGKDEWLLFTATGMAIRFKEDDVRPMGLVAGGVNAIKLAQRDIVIGMETYQEKAEVLLVGENGFAWRIPMREFPLQGRYGQGVIACRLDKNNSLAVSIAGTTATTEIVHFRKAAARYVKIGDIPAGKRPYAGKAIFDVKDDDEVIGQTQMMDCYSLELVSTANKPAEKRNKLKQDSEAEKPDTSKKVASVEKKRVVKKKSKPVKK